MTKNKVISVRPLGFPWETQDPFLFCAYHKDDYPKGNAHMGPADSLAGRNIGQDFTIKDGWRMYHGSEIPGFPYHPHRGFETITIVKEGFVDHTDSMGAAGRFGAGDVQWMTAGKGVQHSEMFPLIYEDKENPLEMFQIWLNLPAKDKMVEPHFKMLWNDEVPVWKETDAEGRSTEVQLVAGKLGERKAARPTPNSWAVSEDHEVTVLTLTMEPGAEWQLPATGPGVTRNLYFYKGSTLTVEDQEVSVDRSVEVAPGETISLKNGSDTGYLLILQGKPIAEPVAKYGPFVMNTPEEIRQAMMDYGRTEFGGWPWPNREQVHDRAKGRFALHADGTEELKSI